MVPVADAPRVVALAPPRPKSGPRVAVMLPMVWSVRNVVHSGVLTRLVAEGALVTALLRRMPSGGEGELPEPFAAATYEPLLEATVVGGARGKPLVDAVLRCAFSRARGVGSYALYDRWQHRRAGAAARARRAVVAALGAATANNGGIARLARLAERLYRANHDLGPVRAQLSRLAPDVVWSTVCVSAHEYPYLLAARDLGISVVTSILSFDNLTSRGWLPAFDRYLVWSEAMGEQLRTLYPRVAPSAVEVTGTPQFDFHRRPDLCWSRERTLRRLGLPADVRYVLYAGSHESLAPAEPALVAALRDRLATHPTLGHHRLVVRLHPLDDGARWIGVAASPVERRATLSRAWDAPADGEGWTLSSLDDQARLVSTVAHADACVNVASTATLDAAILDRPVVGIDFSDERDAPADVLYAEYGADHYAPLVRSGGLRVARRWDELLAHLAAAADHPERDAPQRAAMVDRECGTVDGQSASRVAAAVLGAARRAAATRNAVAR